MKYIIIVLLLFIKVSVINSQINFQDCSESVQRYDLYNQEVNEKFKIRNDYDFEFRLWTMPSVLRSETVFILTFKDGVWDAKYVERDSDNKWKDVPVSNEGLDKMWKLLKRHKVLTLPTHGSLTHKIIYRADSVSVFNEEDLDERMFAMGGTCYNFELRKPNKQRTYYYRSPAAYLKHYPNTEEFYRAYAIIAIVRRHIGLSLDFR